MDCRFQFARQSRFGNAPKSVYPLVAQTKPERVLLPLSVDAVVEQCVGSAKTTVVIAKTADCSRDRHPGLAIKTPATVAVSFTYECASSLQI